MLYEGLWRSGKVPKHVYLHLCAEGWLKCLLGQLGKDDANYGNDPKCLILNGALPLVSESFEIDMNTIFDHFSNSTICFGIEAIFLWSSKAILCLEGGGGLCGAAMHASGLMKVATNHTVPTNFPH